MNNIKTKLIYSAAFFAIFITGVLSGWQLNVKYVNKPAFEILAMGMTDLMYKSALHLKAMHKGSDEIFSDILIQDVKAGIDLIPSIEPYLVTDWGRETLSKRKETSIAILDCVEKQWQKPECDEI